METDFSEYILAVTKLEAVLVGLRITITNPSPFQRALEILAEMDRVFRRETTHADDVDQRENWRRGFSLGDLAAKLVAVSDKPDFAKLKPHLELLAGDHDLSLFSFAPKEEQKVDLVFELRIAACCLQIMTKCKFDDPKIKNPTQTPDIVGDFRGMLWAIECKTLHPQRPQNEQNPESFLQRVKDARDQINSAISSGNANSGLVVINMKNSVDHDALWPAKAAEGDVYYRPHLSIEAAQEALFGVHDRFVTSIRSYLAQNGTSLAQQFSKTKVAPYVLLVYSSIVGILKDGEPTFTMLRLLACEPTPQSGKPEFILMQTLNNCLQDVPNHPLLEPEEIG